MGCILSPLRGWRLSRLRFSGLGLERGYGALSAFFYERIGDLGSPSLDSKAVRWLRTRSLVLPLGQVVLTLGASIEYFRDTVFNYPTLAEAYKVAALDGLNKL